MAAYDLFRGFPRALRFDADAARGEIPRATELLDQVPAGSLLVMDREFTAPEFFMELDRRGVYGLCRMMLILALDETVFLGLLTRAGECPGYGVLYLSLTRHSPASD